MARYGLGYLGSKSLIAEKIINILPASTRLWDLFGGGGAITHCAALLGKFEQVVYNDVGDVATLFYWAVNGIDNFVDTSEFITRKKFFERKDTNPYVKYVYSFGHAGKDFLYGKNIEQWKQCFHNAVIFRDISSFKKYFDLDVPKFEEITDKHELRLAYRRLFGEWFKNKDFTKKINNKTQKSITYMESLESLESLQSLQSLESLQRLERLESLQSLQSLQSLERLERLESLQSLQSLQSLERLKRLESLQSLQSLELLNLSYDDFNITDGIIYCDIPYRNTEGGSYSGFDHDKFYDWAENQSVPIFISEYSMPADRFTPIASIDKRQSLAGNGSGKKVQEKIFVPNEQLELYQNELKIEMELNSIGR